MNRRTNSPRGSGALPDSLLALIRVSGTVATGDAALQQEALERADALAPSRQVEEVLVQSYLFVGFPMALNALAVWRGLAGGAMSGAADGEDDARSRTARGEAICRRVYGDQYDRLRRNIAALHPALDRWMIEEGYGKVMGRPGLTLPERELCVVSLLAVLGVSPQLHSHLRGALRVGTGRDEVEAALREVEDLIRPGHRAMVWKTWRTVSQRFDDEGAV